MSDAVLDFAEKILIRWKPTHTWDDNRLVAWSNDLADQLSGVREEVLNHTLKIMVAERSYTSTPLVADIVKLVARAKGELAAKRRAETLRLLPEGYTDDGNPFLRSDQKAWTKDKVKLAYDLLPTEAGRLAAREGWVAPYWDYIVAHGKAPQPNEYEKLRRHVVDQSFVDDVIRDGRGPVKAIVDAARQRMANAQRLADIANGKQMPSKADYLREVFSGSFTATVKSSPESKYADENFEEGRGWKGWTA